jgi:hypothetical protein
MKILEFTFGAANGEVLAAKVVHTAQQTQGYVPAPLEFSPLSSIHFLVDFIAKSLSMSSELVDILCAWQRL